MVTLRSIRPPVLPASLSMQPPSPAGRTDWSAGEGRPSLPGVFMADDPTGDSVLRFPMFPAGGDFALPAPDELLSQPVTRSLTPEDLRAPSLLVVLRWAARARTTGTLSLATPEHTAAVSALHGRVYLYPQERRWLLAAFTAPRGTFAFVPSEPLIAHRTRYSFSSLIAAGIRAQLEALSPDALWAVFGGRLSFAPVLKVEMEPELEVLGLSLAEERFVLRSLARDTPGERLVGRSPLGRSAALQLFGVLTAFGYLDWVEAR